MLNLDVVMLPLQIMTCKWFSVVRSVTRGFEGFRRIAYFAYIASVKISYIISKHSKLPTNSISEHLFSWGTLPIPDLEPLYKSYRPGSWLLSWFCIRILLSIIIQLTIYKSAIIQHNSGLPQTTATSNC